jgi:predicted ArsR family transcriptional regulator
VEPTDNASLEADQLRPLCSLDDDTRRRLYAYVVSAGEPVSRDRASEALDLDRSLVAYHLDKLVDEGLLAASFARPEGRGGPGAGRPAKYYERADREFAVSLPPRDYRLAAEILARAAELDGTGTVVGSLRQAAAAMGRELAAAEDEDTLVGVLRRFGFEPYDDGGVVRLRNCPFHQLARRHTELVCGVNLAMLSGLTDALDADVTPRLDPAPDRCCVALDAAPRA